MVSDDSHDNNNSNCNTAAVYHHQLNLYTMSAKELSLSDRVSKEKKNMQLIFFFYKVCMQLSWFSFLFFFFQAPEQQNSVPVQPWLQTKLHSRLKRPCSSGHLPGQQR